MSLQPGQSPYPVVEARRPASGPAWNTAAAAVVGVLVVAYTVASIVMVFTQRQGAADATALGAAVAAGSESAVETLDTAINAHIATMHTANVAYQLSFWAMFIAFFGWNVVLRSRLRAVGRRFNRRSSSAWRVWQIGVIISVAMILFVESGGSPNTAEGLASEYHRLMAYYGVRAAVGVVYLWVVYNVWRSAGPLLVASPVTPPGYLVATPPYPPVPGAAYPPASQGFTVPASSYQPPAPQYGPSPSPSPSASPWPGSAPGYPASAPPAGEVPPG